MTANVIKIDKSLARAAHKAFKQRFNDNYSFFPIPSTNTLCFTHYCTNPNTSRELLAEINSGKSKQSRAKFLSAKIKNNILKLA